MPAAAAPALVSAISAAPTRASSTTPATARRCPPVITSRPPAAKGRPGRDRHEAGVAGWVEGDRIERDGHASRWPVDRAAFGVERGGEADQVAAHDRRRAHPTDRAHPGGEPGRQAL